MPSWSGGPGGMGNYHGWETRGGGQWSPGAARDPVNDWTYSTNYSGTIPEGARTFDASPGPRDPRTGQPLHQNPNWSATGPGLYGPGGNGEYRWLNEDGSPMGWTGHWPGQQNNNQQQPWQVMAGMLNNMYGGF